MASTNIIWTSTNAVLPSLTFGLYLVTTTHALPTQKEAQVAISHLEITIKAGMRTLSVTSKGMGKVENCFDIDGDSFFPLSSGRAQTQWELYASADS